MSTDTPQATPEVPCYTKLDVTEDGHATRKFAVVVDEGWRTWILCDGMYEWAADGLIEMIQGRPAPQASHDGGHRD